ncbi:MAG: Alpha amylase catalytic domain protein [Erysipelotrichaceae bacterium]|nr:MAG: Alpha amylase catalytic domain protein [Erysipelotrichaceae bacterium]
MDKTWWKHSVGYQIYPRSFYDSNGDGVGDLKGIITKLDYIKDLGVNLIWIGPFYKSPMDDNGYDVSDFYDVDPLFGTLDDAKNLIAEAHQRGIKIILDLVLNHTSDEHPWFMESRSSLKNPKRDFYIWQDGKKDAHGKLHPPTNWGSFFEGSAWNLDPFTNQYYMKIFSDKMPDLNWASPALREEMFKMASWWLDQGVDGFRVDAIAHLARDLTFTDSTMPLNQYHVAPDWGKFSNRDELYDYLKEFNEKVLSHYDCMSVGEVGGGASVDAGVKYAGYDANIFNMVFNFDTCWQNNIFSNDELKDEDIKINVLNMKLTFDKWIQGMKGKGWMPHYWLNHDHPRVMSQYGDPIHHHKASGSMLGKHMSKDQILSHLRRTSRNNARTPMQWDDSAYAGFSTHLPHQKMVSNYPLINVKRQLTEEDSILNAYKTLIRLRLQSHYSETLIFGDFELIHPKDPNVFAYMRSDEQMKLMIVCNFSKEVQEFVLPLAYKHVVYSNSKNAHTHKTLHLQPYEALILEAK